MKKHNILKQIIEMFGLEKLTGPQIIEEESPRGQKAISLFMLLYQHAQGAPPPAAT
jgi:hypothetical protein